MKNSRSLKWSPSVPLRRPDSIMSSDYTNSAAKHFTPSYEKEEVNMYCLLAMEYGKMWLKEKGTETKIALSAVDSDFLERRYIIRGLLLRRKEQEKAERFIMKKFTKVPPRIRIRTPKVSQDKPKNENTTELNNLEKDKQKT